MYRVNRGHSLNLARRSGLCGVDRQVCLSGYTALLNVCVCVCVWLQEVQSDNPITQLRTPETRAAFWSVYGFSSVYIWVFWSVYGIF